MHFFYNIKNVNLIKKLKKMHSCIDRIFWAVASCGLVRYYQLFVEHIAFNITEII